jgi:hypothetical protein
MTGLLTPVFVLIALTFALLFWLGGSRYLSIRKREVRISDISLGQPAWSPRLTQIDRAYHNQLELPLIFYLLVCFVIVTGAQPSSFPFLEWQFVILRLAHAYVHVTSNHLRARFLLFAAGAMTLLAMWVLFVVALLNRNNF